MSKQDTSSPYTLRDHHLVNFDPDSYLPYLVNFDHPAV
jgi:hypothetical protein